MSAPVDVFTRLYPRKKSQPLNKANSLPLIENPVRESVFSRLYKVPSEIKFPVSDFKSTLKPKHLQPLITSSSRANSVRAAKDINYPKKLIEEAGKKISKKGVNYTKKLTEEAAKHASKKGVNHTKKLIDEANKHVPKKGVNYTKKLTEEAAKNASKKGVNHTKNLIDEANKHVPKKGVNYTKKLVAEADKHVSLDALKDAKSDLQKENNKVTVGLKGVKKQAAGVQEGIKDLVNEPEMKVEKKGLLGRIKGQDSLPQQDKLAKDDEEKLGDKPFVVLSLIDRMNPFRGKMNKGNSTESKEANNAKTNTKGADAASKKKQTNDAKKNWKETSAALKKTANASNAKKKDNKGGEINKSKCKDENPVLDAKKGDLQLFGGYQPHRISKEQLKLRNEILDENRRSSSSFMKGDDQLPLHVNMEESQNMPSWQNDYYLKDENEVEEKSKFLQPVLYNPPIKERHRAGYDSGRTQSTILNNREKNRVLAANAGQGASTSTARIREVDYDKDNSGVYRAKTRKDSQAQIVNDNENTAVELPFDAVDAEEIKDEEIIPLTRKPARELHTNIHDEKDRMDSSYPSVQLFVDERDRDANGKNRLCYSPKEQRDAWCNEMRKLKDKILSKIHNANVDESSNSIKLDLDLEPISKDDPRRPPSIQCETHRMPNNTQSDWTETPPKKAKSKLRKPRIFTHKSTSSCASDATTYTIDSSSSSDIPRNKSSTEETTDSSKLAVVRTKRRVSYSKQTPRTNRTSPTETSPSTLSNDPCFGESATNESFMNDSSISDMNSFRELFNKTYLVEKDSLEDIFAENQTIDEMPSGSNDFPILNSFKPSVPLVQCDVTMDKQNGCKNSFSSNSKDRFGFQGECYSIGVEDGHQVIFFQDEVDMDRLQ